MLARLQVPERPLVALCLGLRREAEPAAEEGEQQGNQTDSHWMDNMVAEEGHYLEQRVVYSLRGKKKSV